MNYADNHKFRSNMTSRRSGRSTARPRCFEGRKGTAGAIRQSGVGAMFRTGALLFCLCVTTPAAYADTNVHLVGSFESGHFKSSGGRLDSFIVRTLPTSQIGVVCISTTLGGGDASSGWDTRVVRSETVAGQIVPPRNGQFFVRSALYYNKDYTCLNNGRPKPRAGLYIGGADAHRVAFDTEAYVGLSIFVPKNFENETGIMGDRGSTVLFGVNADSSASFAALRVFVPKGQGEARWYFDYQTNPYSVTEDRTYETRVDLGRVAPDKGQWTDFIIRFRSNPFSVATNPAKKGIANAHDKMFEGNKGILQVWKAEGTADKDGNRTMKRKVNVLNAPVGNVPGTTNGKSKLSAHMLVYKYGWQRHPTSVKGPVWFGFDEYRLGQVMRDGTSYASVHPAGSGCTDGCPAGSSAPPADEPGPMPPAPPDKLVVIP